MEIAKRHLLPKQLKEHGLKSKDLKIGMPQFEKIVEGYTRESGVRNLDKQLAKMVRYAAKSIATEEDYDIKVSNSDIEKVENAFRDLPNHIPEIKDFEWGTNNSPEELEQGDRKSVV